MGGGPAPFPDAFRVEAFPAAAFLAAACLAAFRLPWAVAEAARNPDPASVAEEPASLLFCFLCFYFKKEAKLVGR